ncbi:MAG TPA: PQQ-binding-like beta-propeller repeat protein [Gemmataceae bacterium]|nr:PQQ-binding-like beta-propeller repeat protein [Gemmataceae bacterium]
MNHYPALRRLIAASSAVFIMGVVFALACTSNQPTGAPTPSSNPVPQPVGDLKTNPWPMWGGSLNRNMVNLRDVNVLTEWDIAKKTNLLWSQELGSKAYGGPAIGDGKIFIGTNNEKPRDPKVEGDKGIIMCFEEGTGKFLWQRVHDKLPSGIVSDWPREGICSTCAIDGKKIYYVSNRCELVCATTDGKDVWSLDMIKELGVFPHNLSTSSPLVAGDLVFAVTSNGVNENHIDIPAPAAPSFVAVNKNTGKVVWTNNDPSKNLLIAAKGDKGGESLFKVLLDKGEILMHGQWSSPVYAVANGKPQIIFPGGDGWLRAYEPESGKEIWRFDCNPRASKYKLGGAGTRNDFISTPVVHDNKVYIGVGQDPEHRLGIGHFWCVDITKKGDVSPKDDNFDPKAPVNKDSALVWHYGEPAPKEWKKGRNYVFGRTLSTAAVNDGLVYIAELASYLHCLDAKTGEQYWTHYLDSPIWSSPYWVDGKVFLGTDGDLVHIFEHGKKKNLIRSLDMGGKVRSTPVVANGIMYIMNEHELFAIGNKK